VELGSQRRLCAVQRQDLYSAAADLPPREARAGRVLQPAEARAFFGYSERTSATTSRQDNLLLFVAGSIIAREMNHVSRNGGMHRMYLQPSNPDSLAFREAFTDVAALFSTSQFWKRRFSPSVDNDGHTLVEM
jgi:hypothetical protein